MLLNRFKPSNILMLYLFIAISLLVFFTSLVSADMNAPLQSRISKGILVNSAHNIMYSLTNRQIKKITSKKTTCWDKACHSKQKTCWDKERSRQTSCWDKGPFGTKAAWDKGLFTRKIEAGFCHGTKPLVKERGLIQSRKELLSQHGTGLGLVMERGLI